MVKVRKSLSGTLWFNNHSIGGYHPLESCLARKMASFWESLKTPIRVGMKPQTTLQSCSCIRDEENKMCKPIRYLGKNNSTSKRLVVVQVAILEGGSQQGRPRNTLQGCGLLQAMSTSRSNLLEVYMVIFAIIDLWFTQGGYTMYLWQWL